MILIASGSYVVSSLVNELGRIPPSFLPLGNKCLYEYQIDILKALEQDIYISVPESYIVSQFDVKRLQELSVEIIKVPDGISLGSSIVYSWLSTGKKYKRLVLMFGDTLFSDINLSECLSVSSFSVHPNKGLYDRAKLESITDGDENTNNQFVEDNSLIISGFFSFQEPHKLMQGIINNSNNFISGLVYYYKNNNVFINRTGEWYDFGHVHSFFLSRSEVTTQRSFNTLKIYSRTVRKSSKNKLKMFAESNWFREIPSSLKLYTPTLVSNYKESSDYATYDLEYLYLLPLSDLLVFSEIPITSWRNILTECRDLIQKFKAYTSDSSVTSIDCKLVGEIYLEKSLDRLASIENKPIEVFINRCGYSLYDNSNYENSVEELLLSVSQAISEVSTCDLSIIHGDFCFSNILYDSRVQSIKVIDPRGLDAQGKISIYGDSRYDVAKLYHSIVGFYDFIISGHYSIKNKKLEFSVSQTGRSLEQLFDEVFFDNHLFKKDEIIAINVMLFLSMIPLHDDQPTRQQAMFLNAVRLAQKLREGSK